MIKSLEGHYNQRASSWDDHTDWVIRDKRERYHPDCTQKRRRTTASQFSVWAMVAVGYKSRLIFYQTTEEVDQEIKNGKVRQQRVKMGGPMAQKCYASENLPIVCHRMLELQHLHGKDMIFQEDNDGSHGTRSEDNICRFTKCDMELDYIDDWPANSPDLNPIENVWRILKSRVKLHHAMTEKELKIAIEKEWKAIKQDGIDEYILG